MARRIRRAALILTLTAALATVASFSATPVTAYGQASWPTRATVPARLVGTWGKTVTLATWRKNGESGEPGGHWGITITSAGLTKMFAPAPIGFFTSMRVSTSGASVVFGPTADGVCPGKASYTWKISGSTLVLKAVKDGCSVRQVLLTAGPWKRG